MDSNAVQKKRNFKTILKMQDMNTKEKVNKNG